MELMKLCFLNIFAKYSYYLQIQIQKLLNWIILRLCFLYAHLKISPCNSQNNQISWNVYKHIS